MDGWKFMGSLYRREENHVQTNYERIMSMTQKELAFWMAMNLTCCNCPVDLDACHELEMSSAMSCEEILLDWLKKEADK